MCLVCKVSADMVPITFSNDIVVNESYDRGDDILYCSYCGSLYIDRDDLAVKPTPPAPEIILVHSPKTIGPAVGRTNDLIHERKELLIVALKAVIDIHTADLPVNADNLLRTQLQEQFRFWRDT